MLILNLVSTSIDSNVGVDVELIFGAIEAALSHKLIFHTYKKMHVT